MNVFNGSPADHAGLKDGDVIISLAGQPVTSVDDIHKLLTAERIGQISEVVFLRNWTQRLETVVTPSENQG